MRIFIAATVIAVALAGFLVWAPPSLSKGAYKFGFLLGLAAFSMTIWGPSEFIVDLGHNPGSHFVAVLLALMMSAPGILLIEAGLSGYRGFSSWMRYVSLSLVVLGGTALMLIAAYLAPRLLHR